LSARLQSQSSARTLADSPRIDRIWSGRPLLEVAALASHRDIKMTLRYAHLAPSHLRAGIQALEQRNAHHPVGPALSTEARVTPVSQDFFEDRVSAGVPNGTQHTTERPLSFTIDLLVEAA
jgi:hypothetical protein